MAQNTSLQTTLYDDSTEMLPRYLEIDELEFLKSEGYPMDQPEKYSWARAGPDSQNSGRVYLRFDFIWVYWRDTPKPFDPTEHNGKLAKRRREQESFAQRQRLMANRERFNALQKPTE